MCERFSEPPKMILTLVPDVGADKQDGATESTGPPVVVDVAVSGRQETGALGAGELALVDSHVHAAVHPVCPSKLQGRAGPVFKDVLASLEEVRFAFPGWPQEAFPVCFVENGGGSAPASYGPVARDLVDVQTLDGHGDVVCGDVKGGGIRGVVVSAYWGSPAGRYRGRSVVSWRLMQGLHRAT